ncbi:MAG TPA: cupin domain-containing protein [Streptosporangiaceae bacterium]|nr:cupin domain-containing protein [Streptosporangiaceae bacterium]
MATADVTVTELLNDSHGSHGLHQRLLTLCGITDGTADGAGEAWYVATGTGHLHAPAAHDLSEGSAVWLPGGMAYEVSGDGLRIIAVTVRAATTAGAPAEPHLVRYEDCAPEWTGDRQFRVLLSAGLNVTQFVGVIPPGRAPEHQHTYDEVVHVLSGGGVVHLPGGDRPITPGTSIYLAPGTPHCLENTEAGDLRVLGVFHPAGSPAAKTVSG